MSPHWATLEKFQKDDKQLEVGFGNKVTSVGREDIRQICKYLGLNFITRGQGSQKKIYALKLDRVRGKKRADEILSSVPKGVANFFDAVCALMPEHKSKLEDWFAQFLGGHTEALSTRHLRNEDDVTMRGGKGATGNIGAPKPKGGANFRGGVVGFGDDAEEEEKRKKEEEERRQQEEEKKMQEEAEKLKQLKKEQKKLKKQAKKEIKKVKKKEKKEKKKQQMQLMEVNVKAAEKERAKKEVSVKRAADSDDGVEAKRRKEEPEPDDEESSDADFQEEVWEAVDEFLPPIEIVEDDSWARDYCDLIRSVYEEKNPSKTPEEIDELFEKYSHKLYDLYISVCQKYDVDPMKHQEDFDRRRDEDGDDIFARLARQDRALLGNATVGISSDEAEEDNDEDDGIEAFWDKYTAFSDKLARGKGKGKGKEKGKGKGQFRGHEDAHDDRGKGRPGETVPKEVCVAGFGDTTTQKHLEKFFEDNDVGGVERVRFIENANKRLCFFTFKTEQQADMAVELNGKRLKGDPLYIQHAQVTRKTGGKGANKGEKGADPKQCFVAGIKDSDEESIKSFFEDFSPRCSVEYIKVLKNEDGQSKGVCFITFCTEKGAQKALEANGTEFHGGKLSVRPAHGKREVRPQRPRRESQDWSKDAKSAEGLTGLKWMRDEL